MAAALPWPTSLVAIFAVVWLIIAFMPPDDPGVIPECSVPAHSNQDAEAFDYSCVVRSANTRR